MKWNWLPEAGGLYDQNPEMLERFFYIFQTRSKHEADQAAEEKRKRDTQMGKGIRRPSMPR